MRRRHVLGLIGFLGAIQAGAGKVALAGEARAANGLTLSAAVNKAGRLRMLSQRTAKAWLMIGQGILPERGQTILGGSLSLFENHLTELKGFTPSEDARLALAQLEREWGGYKTALAAAPNRGNANPVYEASEVAQEKAHRLVLAYEKSAGAPGIRLVNMAGRQRMLSQRMAKFHLFKVWNVNPIAAQMEFNFSRAEFSSGMHQLFVAPRTTPDIQAALARLDREWVKYRESLTAPRTAAEIMELSETVLEACEGLAALYEKAAANGGH